MEPDTWATWAAVQVDVFHHCWRGPVSQLPTYWGSCHGYTHARLLSLYTYTYIYIHIYIYTYIYIYILIDPQYIIISTVSLVVYPYCNSCCLSKIFASKSASCWVAIGLSDSQLLQLLGVFCAIVCTDKFVNLQDLLFLTQSGVTLVRMNRLPIFPHQKWGRAPSLACIVLFEVHMLYDHQLFFKLDGTSCCLEFW